MKVKHITLLTALAVIALLFVGGAAASGTVTEQSSVTYSSNIIANTDSNSLTNIDSADSSCDAKYASAGEAGYAQMLKAMKKSSSSSAVLKQGLTSDTSGNDYYHVASVDSALRKLENNYQIKKLEASSKSFGKKSNFISSEYFDNAEVGSYFAVSFYEKPRILR